MLLKYAMDAMQQMDVELLGLINNLFHNQSPSLNYELSPRIWTVHLGAFFIPIQSNRCATIIFIKSCSPTAAGL